MSIDTKISPMMAQWHALKSKAGDALLLFRLGDFYEAFYDDAFLLSKELDLTLTKRNEIPMSGIPQQTLQTYLDRLIARGYKAAIAEQVEDPKLTKGIVKREIVRIVTAGTIINSNLLQENANNFLACITLVNSFFGIAFLDLTTASFRVLEIQSENELLDELIRLSPSEILVSEKCHRLHSGIFKELMSTYPLTLNVKEEWQFDHKSCLTYLLDHFKVHSLDGYGLQGMVPAVNAAGALLSYVHDELNLSITHIDRIYADTLSSYMLIDRATQKHLELTQSLHDGSEKNTLFSLLDQTATPMGARLLKEYLLHPLIELQAITMRHDALDSFIAHAQIFPRLKESLRQIRDIERLLTRIATNYASPKDLFSLNQSIKQIPHVKELLSPLSSSLIRSLTATLVNLDDLTTKVDEALNDPAPFRLSDGNVFKAGYCDELDDLLKIKSGSTQWLANYQSDLREKTAIKTLKIGYTKAFGYYIEVSRIQSHKMPQDFERNQTLVNAERFISKELKEYERKVLTAEETIAALEGKLFDELKQFILSFQLTLKKIAASIGELDVLFSLAHVSLHRRYVRPRVDHSKHFEVKQGRHPIVEATIKNHEFVPNDVSIRENEEQLLLITGPNMAGKSTYLRQVALIAILSQIGCFVPATYAHLGIIDKVFSRIGASDDLSSGKSTFMVEMSETANILNNATSSSLVILDEIGRGTSTYDGISIAWAVIDYLLTTPGKQAKTLFATHYFELTELENELPGIVNYHVAVHEHEGKVTFLHKINRGETDKSYGIYVARLAGLPLSVIRKSQEILAKIEKGSCRTLPKGKPLQKQLNLFTQPSEEESRAEKLVAEIKKLDLNELTPIQAHQKLCAYQAILHDIRH